MRSKCVVDLSVEISVFVPFKSLPPSPPKIPSTRHVQVVVKLSFLDRTFISRPRPPILPMKKSGFTLTA